ncbi:HAAS signaling domain-containing protein [Lacisediminihabitans sp.]|uniref:HAAS signaling domain-containing protein n=1 Tax=Lacisediminihabitans sp. TaxID=2787631 RepID=UPI00374D5D2B
MTETNTPKVVRGYLADLDRELAGVSEEVRQGIVAGVREELEGLDAAAAASRIESLGDPAFIAAEARAGIGPGGSTASVTELAPPRASEQRWYVFVTGFLLEFGGIVVPLAGWVAGIMMLWASSLWTRSEKLVAIIVPPAVGVALFGIFALVGGARILFWHALVLGAIAGPVIASIVIGIVLSRRGWDRAR